MKQLPNLMTTVRLGLTILVFMAMIALSARPILLWAYGSGIDVRTLQVGLYQFAFWGFIVAAITDFLDGWLARRFDATSTLGAILDPIADKVLVAGAVIGLTAMGAWMVGLAGGLILFREFAVSAMREVLAPKGLKLPVTMLAKWKTTLQLVALTVQLFVGGWEIWGLPRDEEMMARASVGADVLLWIAAAVTVWTGLEYARSARKALAGR